MQFQFANIAKLNEWENCFDSSFLLEFLAGNSCCFNSFIIKRFWQIFSRCCFPVEYTEKPPRQFTFSFSRLSKQKNVHMCSDLPLRCRFTKYGSLLSLFYVFSPLFLRVLHLVHTFRGLTYPFQSLLTLMSLKYTFWQREHFNRIKLVISRLKARF